MTRRPPSSPLFPYTTLFRSAVGPYVLSALPETAILLATAVAIAVFGSYKIRELQQKAHEAQRIGQYQLKQVLGFGDRKSTRLNSSHTVISYAVFCLKKKKKR